MKVHVVSETAYLMKGQGVHTAFVESVELLKEKKDIEVIINGEGFGDVFHSHSYGPYYFWKGRKYKNKRIHTAHVIPDSIKGSLPMWQLLFPVIKWYFKKVYSFADVIIAISPMVEQAIKQLGVTTKIVRIYNPVLTDKWTRNEEKRSKGRKLLGINNEAKIVLGVGQLQSRKGVEDFLDIAAAFPEAQFIWVGGRPFGIFTEGIKRINSRIKSSPANVHFAGLLDLSEMQNIYAAADIFLFPSYQENCPLAPLEAAASGLPVIYRDIKEYSLLYQNPYLRAKDTDGFIELTRKLIYDKEFYLKGIELSENLIKQFDKNEIRKQLVHLYKSLVLPEGFRMNNSLAETTSY
jgi:1,2-diacylglycerol-3-alpha-glucose alpha-1,2-galactosyltransferase